MSRMTNEQLKLFLWRWNVEKPDLTNEEGMEIVEVLEASWEENAELKAENERLRLDQTGGGIEYIQLMEERDKLKEQVEDLEGVIKDYERTR